MAIYWVNTISVISDLTMFATVPIYIIIIYILFKFRHDELFKQSFFTLIISVGIADIGKVLSMFFGQRLAGYGWIAEVYMAIGSLAAQLYAIFSYFFGAAQVVGVFLIACNRFSAYVFPVRHKKIWQDGKVILVLIALKWLISFANIIPMISYYRFKFTFAPGNNRSMFPAWVNSKDSSSVNIYNNVVGKGSIITLTIFLYIIILAVAINRKFKVGTWKAVEKTALGMSVIGFAHCIGIVLYLIATVFSATGLVGCDSVGHSSYCVDTSVNFLLMNLGINLCASVTPYALLIFSSSVRVHFINLCRSSCLLSCCFSSSEQLNSVVNISTARRI